MQDSGGLGHLHHKCRLSAGDVVRCTHTGKDLVYISYSGTLCRNEASHLGHKHYKGSLAQQGTLTGHVGTCKDNHLLGIVIQPYIVGHILLANLHKCFNYRVSALLNIQFVTVVHLRTAVFSLASQHCESHKTVYLRQCVAAALYSGNLFLDSHHHLMVDLLLQRTYLLLRAKNLLLILLQLLGNVSLRIHKGLLADPIVGNLILMGVPYLQIISEYVVIAYLQ